MIENEFLNFQTIQIEDFVFVSVYFAAYEIANSIKQLNEYAAKFFQTIHK